MSFPTIAPSPALFFETMNAFQRTAALRAAIELDLFSAIAAGTGAPDDVAKRCEASERGVRILCDTLTILGFLVKQSMASMEEDDLPTSRYRLTPDTAAFLDKKSPAYLGGAMKFLLLDEMIAPFGCLAAAVKKGGCAQSAEGTISKENPAWVEFARGMGPLMVLPAKKLADLLGGDHQRPLKVLDLAAGHGLFGITLLQAFPHAEVVAQDWSSVLLVAAEHAQKAGVTDRHRLLPGNAFEVDLGTGYDVVLLTNFLHHFDSPTIAKLLKRIHACLKPGGQCLTLEFVPNTDRITPPGTAMFALIMLATTPHGDAYTFAEYDQLFTAAGFTQNHLHGLAPTQQQVIVSHRV